jgi:hypothetical protein
MTVELDRLRSLASVIGAAEDQLAVARWTLRETAMALLRCGARPWPRSQGPRVWSRANCGSRPRCASTRDPNIQSPARPSGRGGRDADRR